MKSYNEDIGDHLKGVWREKQCGMLQPMCQQSLCATPVCGGTWGGFWYPFWTIDSWVFFSRFFYPLVFLKLNSTLFKAKASGSAYDVH